MGHSELSWSRYNRIQDMQERDFNEWVWSREAAMHFLATRRVKWMKEAVEVEAYGRLLGTKGTPPLWDDITHDFDTWQALGIDIRARAKFSMLGNRRSLRQFSDA